MDADDIKDHATADGRRWPPIETGAQTNESASTMAETSTSIDNRRSALDKITESIIGCVHRVSKILGAGFLEKVYENALATFEFMKVFIGGHRRPSAVYCF